MSSTSDDCLPFPSRSGLTSRRHSSAEAQGLGPGVGEQQHPPPTPRRPPIHVDVEPPPKAKPIVQVFSFALIVLFSVLQFFPATHFRDPANPFRGQWIPADHYHRRLVPDHPNTNSNLGQSSEIGNTHIVSWINCLDVRVLAVLVNSTLTSSRLPENVYFHFFLPGSGDEQVSFHKLKVLFPDSNIDIIGQKEIKQKIATAIPEVEHLWPIPPILAPFMISRIKSSLRKFIYMPPDAIVKGSIDDLFTTDMRHYAIAAGEDCNKRLHDHVNIEIVNAVQRTAAKDWVLKELYDGNACMPDLNILLLDATRLEKKLLEAILWWNAVLGKNIISDEVYPSVALSLSNRFVKLSPSWNLGGCEGSQLPNDSHVLCFDGPRMHCPENHEQQEIAAFGNNWRQHISIKSEIMLRY